MVKKINFKLTRVNEDTLAAVVEYATQHGGVLPPSEDIGKALKIIPGTAKKRITTLREKKYLVIEEDSELRLNETQFPTERHTAKLLVELYECTVESPNRVEETELIQRMLPDFDNNQESVKGIIEQCVEFRYIKRDSINAQYLRRDYMLEKLIGYLRKRIIYAGESPFPT